LRGRAQCFLVAREHDDAHAALDETAGHGETNPARCAGDDGRARFHYSPSYST